MSFSRMLLSQPSPLGPGSGVAGPETSVVGIVGIVAFGIATSSGLYPSGLYPSGKRCRALILLRHF